jgi:hypothetical protein
MTCLALVLIAALQLALPGRTELPDAPALAPRRARSPVVTPVVVPAALNTSDVFSPDRAGDGDGGAAGSMADCALLGVASIGGRSTALVKSSGQPARLVRVGEPACGGRLAHLDRGSATFTYGGRRLVLIAGQSPPAPAAAAAAPSHGEDASQ